MERRLTCAAYTLRMGATVSPITQVLVVTIEVISQLIGGLLIILSGVTLGVINRNEFLGDVRTGSS